jgi:hypothetical protein
MFGGQPSAVLSDDLHRAFPDGMAGVQQSESR